MIGRFAAAWIGRLAATCLLMAAPAAGQTRVYTNADLGQPLTWAACPDARGARLGCRTAVRTDAGGSGRPQGDDHRRRPVARAIWRVCAVGNPAARSQLARGHLGLLGGRRRAAVPGGPALFRGRPWHEPPARRRPHVFAGRATRDGTVALHATGFPPTASCTSDAADRERCRGGLAVAPLKPAARQSLSAAPPAPGPHSRHQPTFGRGRRPCTSGAYQRFP